MRGLKVKNSTVEKVAIFNTDTELPNGWIEAPAGVGIGWADNGDGTFSAPPPEPAPEPTVGEQIAALEATVTARWLRGAALGDTYSIAELQKVEDAIAALRV